MLQPYHGAARLHQFGEDVREVAASGADVEDARAGAQVGQEGFAGRGVHVGRGDGGAVAYGLRGVFVGEGGGVVGAVNLGLIRLKLLSWIFRMRGNWVWGGEKVARNVRSSWHS